MYVVYLECLRMVLRCAKAACGRRMSSSLLLWLLLLLFLLWWWCYFFRRCCCCYCCCCDGVIGFVVLFFQCFSWYRMLYFVSILCMCCFNSITLVYVAPILHVHTTGPREAEVERFIEHTHIIIARKQWIPISVP